MEAHKGESDKASRKKMKNDLEQRWRDLKGLETTISQYEYDLWRARAQPENAPVSDDDQSDPRTEGTMAISSVANDAPPASATPESLSSPPGEEQTRSMEVDDGGEHQTPTSPISHREDELLTGDAAVGVEGEMANLVVSSPGDGDGGDEDASI